jgi:hypothetical protein
MAEAPGILPRAGEKGDRLQMEAVFAQPPAAAVPAEPAPTAAVPHSEPAPISPLNAQIPAPPHADLVARARQLIVAGDIPNARLVLQQAAEAGNATAALELGATYDPIELAKLDARHARQPPIFLRQPPVASTLPSVSVGFERMVLPDIAMARTWYQKAKDLGSTEAQGRLENLAARDQPKR